jgi:5-methyltetrahydrofolate--homocysteine methyltransferase
MPEQSTVAIIAHHPQAVYFGMKSGFIPEEPAPDEVIAGGDRSGELPPEIEPAEGSVEAEGEQRAGDEVPAG